MQKSQIIYKGVDPLFELQIHKSFGLLDSFVCLNVTWHTRHSLALLTCSSTHTPCLRNQGCGKAIREVCVSAKDEHYFQCLRWDLEIIPDPSHIPRLAQVRESLPTPSLSSLCCVWSLLILLVLSFSRSLTTPHSALLSFHGKLLEQAHPPEQALPWQAGLQHTLPAYCDRDAVQTLTSKEKLKIENIQK